MKQLKTPPPIARRQRIVGSALNAGLATIAIVILITQAHHDPNRWQAPTRTTKGVSSNSISNPFGTVDFRSLAPVTAEGD